MLHLKKNKETFEVNFTKKKRIYYENPDMKNVTDNTIFSKTAVQFF